MSKQAQTTPSAGISTPIIILLVVIVVVGGWYFLSKKTAATAATLASGTGTGTTAAPSAAINPNLGSFPAGTALPATGTLGQSISVGGMTYQYEVNGQNGYQGQTGWKYKAA